MATAPKDNSAEDLAELARKLQEQAEKPSGGSGRSALSRTIGNVQVIADGVHMARRVYSAIKAPFVKVNNGVVQPVAHVVLPVARPLWHGYKWLLKKTDPSAYENKIVKAAALTARVCLAFLTIAVGAIFVPGFVAGAHMVRYYTTDVVRDAALMAWGTVAALAVGAGFVVTSGLASAVVTLATIAVVPTAIVAIVSPKARRGIKKFFGHVRDAIGVVAHDLVHGFKGMDRAMSLPEKKEAPLAPSATPAENQKPAATPLADSAKPQFDAAADANKLLQALQEEQKKIPPAKAPARKHG